MPQATHPCPKHDCEEQVPNNQLACRKDWYSLPIPYRRAVVRAWDGGKGRGSKQHTAAVMAAIGWLNRERGQS